MSSILSALLRKAKEESKKAAKDKKAVSKLKAVVDSLPAVHVSTNAPQEEIATAEDIPTAPLRVDSDTLTVAIKADAEAAAAKRKQPTVLPALATIASKPNSGTAKCAVFDFDDCLVLSGTVRPAPHR